MGVCHSLRYRDKITPAKNTIHLKDFYTMLSNKYNEPTPGNPQEKSKTKQAIIIGAVLIGLLGLLNLVIVLRGNAKLELATNLNDEQTKLVSNLQREIASANARFDSLSNLFPAKEEEIESLKRQLAEKEQELQRYISNGGNLTAAKNEIASLKNDNRSLQALLDEERNKNLTSEARIEALTQELNNMRDELLQTKDRLSQYQNANTPNPQEPTTIDPSPNTPQKPNKPENLDKPLGVSGVSVKANEISKKDPTQKRETKSASRTHELQICFVVEPTEGVGPSTQEFHFQIIDPTQTAIGSSVASDKSSGNEYKYTLAEAVNYDGASAQVCSFYKSGEFMKGSYVVNVWNKGVNIGSATVTLKK